MKCFWITGLPGSGKTKLANFMARVIRHRGFKVMVIDGEDIRKDISADLGFEFGDRLNNAVRAAGVARMCIENDIVPICALVSPFPSIRNTVMELMEWNGYHLSLIYVDTPWGVCERRRGCPIGVGYDPPTNADLVVSGQGDFKDNADLARFINSAIRESD